MIRVALGFSALEKDLRSQGFNGTHRPLRLLSELKSALEEIGVDFSSATVPVKEPLSKDSSESFDEALANL